mmetsp:Transcript_81885/g.187385  ORF Transcript_81885/g.187385 Transcript_81885/m.187385 type:complete len:214 (+) Transcript_81885:43-684(+)
MLTAMCSSAGIPERIMPVVNDALDWGYRASTAWINTDLGGIAASVPLQDVAATLQAAVSGASPRLALWSTHDTTLMPIMQALGAWDNRWPRYAMVMGLELYEKDGEHFVRITQDGAPIASRLCNGALMCPLDTVMAIIDSWVQKAKACKDARPTISALETFETGLEITSEGPGMAWFGGAAAVVIVLVMGAYLPRRKEIDDVELEECVLGSPE